MQEKTTIWGVCSNAQRPLNGTRPISDSFSDRLVNKMYKYNLISHILGIIVRKMSKECVIFVNTCRTGSKFHLVNYGPTHEPNLEFGILYSYTTYEPRSELSTILSNIYWNNCSN
jgi:hypothetical protein